MEFTKLNNGVEMPMQGIGTFLLSPDEAEASATYALKNKKQKKLCKTLAFVSMCFVYGILGCYSG